MKNLWTEDAILWLGQAELDLSTARQLIVTASYAACFYAQQASEKALKSVCVLYGLALPRVHSIGRLIAGLEEQFSMVSAHRDSAAILDG
jgi:HEPN domain-containing protein